MILTSAQAGGNVVTGYYKAGMVNRILDPVYHAMDKMGGLRFYTYPVPEAQEQDLDGQRLSLIHISGYAGHRYGHLQSHGPVHPP